MHFVFVHLWLCDCVIVFVLLLVLVQSNARCEGLCVTLPVFSFFFLVSLHCVSFVLSGMAVSLFYALVAD